MAPDKSARSANQSVCATYVHKMNNPFAVVSDKKCRLRFGPKIPASQRKTRSQTWRIIPGFVFPKYTKSRSKGHRTPVTFTYPRSQATHPLMRYIQVSSVRTMPLSNADEFHADNKLRQLKIHLGSTY